MEVIALQSGSNGNCIYLESDGVRLLFDAGISGRQAQMRLAASGRDISDVHGLIISHEHRDHASGMGIYQRKFGLPIHISRPTLMAAKSSTRVGELRDVQHFDSGSTLQFGHVAVQTIPTPHDAVDGVGFIVDDGKRRLGILTDLGHVFTGLLDLVKTLDALIIESNYDSALLEGGHYPQMLKSRIQGPGGHLSNDDSAGLLRAAQCRRLQWVCLGHLSEDNNHPELAAEVHRRVVGSQLPVRVASRWESSEVMDV